MNIRFHLVLSASLALVGAMSAPMKADEWNKETKLEFSSPVEVPGKVLPAGKYVFRLAESNADRNIVQIFSEDENGAQKLVTTILAISDYRIRTPEKAIVQFEERRSGKPEAIRSWFYPGDNSGWEFLYPKVERMAMNPNAAPADDPAPASSISSAAPQEPPPAPQPVRPAASQDDFTIAAQNEAPALTPSPSNDNLDFTERTLPHTAGYSGLELISGLVMLGGGVAVVLISRRKALA